MAATTTELPAPRLDGYAAAQVTFAARAWPMRAAEELRSAMVFRAMAQAARAIGGAAAPWAPVLWRAVRDELRHARLCTLVGARLGALPPRHDLWPVRARVGGLGRGRARLAALLLVEAAIGETVSMALFRAGRRAAAEPLTRAALTSILVDEVRHARLGWAAATALWPELVIDRERLQREVTAGLGALEMQIAYPALKRLDAGDRFDPALARLGMLAPEARVEAFYDAVERLVLPRLTRLGLDGQAAWRERYQANVR
jgi:hypothetical protein